jgi:hypothetical protein
MEAMLQLSPRFYNCPVLSLRTGGVIAVAAEPIINPNNLKIEGFYCVDRFDKKISLILLYQDIREVIPQGIVVNDHEVLSQREDIIRHKNKIGRVNDFAVELETMFVQKLYVSQALRKSLSTSALSIDRSQIIEITDKKIIINDLAATASVRATAVA